MESGRNNAVASSLKWITMLIVTTYCGDRTLGLACKRLFLCSDYRYSRLFDSRLPCDILVIGNSRGIHSFYRPEIQKITGKEVANVSSNGMPAELFSIAFRCYLERHAAPELLLVEVSAAAKEPANGSLERFLPMCQFDESLSDWMREASPRFCFASRISHLFRYNSELFTRSQFFHKTHDQNWICLLYTSPSPRDATLSRMPSSA